MSVGLKANVDGTSGAVQVNGNDVVTVNSAGNVGIGTNSVATGYKVESTGSFKLTSNFAVYAMTTANGRGWRMGNTSNGTNLGYFYIQGTTDNWVSSFIDGLFVDASGNVGIGTSSPSYQLQLSTNSAAKPTSNVWTVASDERVKTVTGEYTKGLDAVCSLRPVTYKYNGKAGFVADGSENISIIAQEAMEAFPECIGTFSAKLNETDEEETELLNWDGHALTFALVNAIKELKAQNEDLRARIAALEARP